MSIPQDEVREAVRERYAAAAASASRGFYEEARSAEASCCGAEQGCGCSTSSDPGSEAGAFGAELYHDRQTEGAPQAAIAASLGCGVPTAVAELRAGETVLDLGSGAGVDVLLSARRVGPGGKVYGLDMTEEMLALARRNVEEAGVANVELLKGYIEAIPLPASTVDVVISNCVVNLSPDKPAVLGEVFRVLKPGGRLGISDVVAEDHLTPADRAERGTVADCIGGALSIHEYESLLAQSGFRDVTVTVTHAVADGMHGAIVQARKPGTG